MRQDTPTPPRGPGLLVLTLLGIALALAVVGLVAHIIAAVSAW